MKTFLYLVLVGVLIFSIAGCGKWRRAETGAAVGAGAGAAAGAVIGKQAGNTAVGAILGAVIGGAAGMYIGDYMDRQVDEMKKDLEGARIERVGEGIKITFESGILYDVNSSTLRQEAKDNLTSLAEILNKYEETEVLVEGHTDSTGPRDYNMDLSLRRAQSVANHMTGLNVRATRFRMMGYGPDQPVADNTTSAGRQANRRVEIAIFANDKLKNVAKSQTND